MDRIRTDYGNDVNFIIELLATNELMSYPNAPDGINGAFLQSTRARQERLLTGSGDIDERAKVYGADANLVIGLNGGANIGLTDGGVHYSPRGYRLLGDVTANVIRSKNLEDVMSK